ncbi:MAG: ABC transporter permease, partial [Candidatus Limnocylindrales bacterium]
DDASAALLPISADLAWGQILFVFLGLPGVALAVVLARLSSQSGTQQTRRHVSLLRARGATQRQLAFVLVGSELVVAFLGALVGALGGMLLALALFGSDLANADPAGIARVLLMVVPLTVVLAVLGAASSLRSIVTGTVATGRQELQRTKAPLWRRLYLDVALIVAGAGIYVAVSASGVHPAINTEGNPTVTLALSSFVAPFVLWLGGALLVLRLAGLALERSGRVSAPLGRLLGPGGSLAAPSLAAHAAAASRLLALIALAMSFAISVSMFQATYQRQQRVDAALTLGADLKATPNGPSDATAVAAVAAAGASAVTPFSQKVVYVGSEAQDLLAIDPATLPMVSPLGDGFFQGSTAVEAMNALRQNPAGVLVSSETATDYSIVPGDHLKIRVPDANGVLREVDFQMVGIALEFPTAPKDAFLVANLDYVARSVGDPRISFVLGRTAGDDDTAAITARLGTPWHVEGLSGVTAHLANSITSVDLGALVLIDILFAVLIASVGAAAFILAGLADRARELAALQAVGAEPGQVRSLLAGEIGTIGVAGVIAGLGIGVAIGYALLTILAGIFDPPADAPVMPWITIGVIVAATMVGILAAFLVASGYASRMQVLRELRDR